MKILSDKSQSSFLAYIQASVGAVGFYCQIGQTWDYFTLLLLHIKKLPFKQKPKAVHTFLLLNRDPISEQYNKQVYYDFKFNK